MRQAAADGSISTSEYAAIAAAENDMAAADAAVYSALAGTLAGQMLSELESHMPDFTEAYLQASVLSGADTECY